MKELKIVDIKLKIIRGRGSPSEERFPYNTIVEYYTTDESKNLTMSISPPTFFILKQVLNEELDDLQRVIFHTIRPDDRLFFQNLFQNNLIKISMKKALAIVDRIVIDKITPIKPSTYNYAASIYLTNGERIPNVIPSDAVFIGLLAGKSIYIDDSLLELKDKIDQEIAEKTAVKEEGPPTGKEEKKGDPNSEILYT